MSARGDPGARTALGRPWHRLPDDPGLVAVRGAVRAAIVTTLAFFLGLEVVGDEQTALFASIGSLALLLFVDFGGPRGARLAAYLALAVVGAAVIPIGTLCASRPVAAALAMAVVGFVILFAGVINGYLAAGATAALLMFILPTMIPADAAEIPDRLIGWGIACALSIPAALLLWPARPRDLLRAGVAATCRAIAELVAEPSEANATAARESLDALHERFAATPFRPTGPTGATAALAGLVEQLDWLRGRATQAATRARAGAATTPDQDRLRASTATVLRTCAEQIEGHPQAAPDLERFERERAAVIDELLAEPALRGDDDRAWTAITAGFDVRVQSYGAAEIAALASEARGGGAGESGPRWARFARRQRVATTLAASRRLAAAHTSVRSVWFRNSVRGSAGLALAVLIAQLISLQHAFWVALGVLSVLRSSALATGSTVVQALAGTTVGIVVGGALLIAIGTQTTVLWILLPITVALAAYAPRVISFAAGQAAFTVAVLIIFNLIAPTGWEVGLVRIEDVALGCAISLVVGVLFWPRGAAALLSASLGAAYARAGEYAAAAFARLAGDDGGHEVDDLRLQALAAEGRLDAAFRQQLAERGGRDRGVAAHGRLMGGAIRIRHTGDAMRYFVAVIGDAPRPAAAAHQLVTASAEARDWYTAFGAALAGHGRVPAPEPPQPGGRAAALAGLRAALADDERPAAVAALVLAWAQLHVERVREHEARVVEAARPAQPA